MFKAKQGDEASFNKDDRSGSVSHFMRDAVQRSQGVAIDLDFSTHLQHFPYMYQARFKRSMENQQWDVSFHRDIVHEVLHELMAMPLFHEDNVGLCVLDESVVPTKTLQSTGEFMPVVEYLWFKKWIPSVAGLLPSKIRQNSRCDYSNLDDRLNRLSNARIFGVRFPLYLNSHDPDTLVQAFMSINPYVDAAFSAGLVPLIQCHFLNDEALDESVGVSFVDMIDGWLDTLENERQQVMLGFSTTSSPFDISVLVHHPNVMKVFNCDRTIGPPDIVGHQRRPGAMAMMLNHWVDLMMYNTLDNETLFKRVKDCHWGQPVLYR